MTSNIAAKNKPRIGKILVSSVVNGPGPRFVIWFQGCRFQCQGCFNPEFWDEEGGTPVRIEEIAEQINSTPNPTFAIEKKHTNIQWVMAMTQMAIWKR